LDLAAALEYFEAQPYSFEVVAVDDGSSDRTPEVLRAWEQRNAGRLRAICYRPNRGKGCAVRTGMLAARGEVRMFADAGLSAAQIESLERLRAEFQRDAIRRDADLRVAEMDLAALLRTDTVDLVAAEAKVREIERLRAETRLARIRAIEEGKMQLTVEQRAKLRTLLAQQAARPREAPVRRSR